jgi:hypothetical protein
VCEDELALRFLLFSSLSRARARVDTFISEQRYLCYGFILSSMLCQYEKPEEEEKEEKKKEKNKKETSYILSLAAHYPAQQLKVPRSCTAYSKFLWIIMRWYFLRWFILRGRNEK